MGKGSGHHGGNGIHESIYGNGIRGHSGGSGGNIVGHGENREGGFSVQEFAHNPPPPKMDIIISVTTDTTITEVGQYESEAQWEIGVGGQNRKRKS